jgi:hypothetical protein
LALLHLLPETIVDDLQVRDLLDDPCAFRSGPRLTPTGVRVFDELLTVPDQPADIKFVVENARATLPIAIDGGGAPAPAGGTWDVLLVQRMGDGLRRAAIRELFKDTADDGSFGFVDAPVATDRFAGGVELAHDVVTVAETPARLALANAAFQPASRLLRKVLEEQGIHGAFETDMQFANFTLRQSDGGPSC